MPESIIATPTPAPSTPRFSRSQPEPMSDPAPESVAPATGLSRLTARTPASRPNCESALSGTTATWPAVPSARRARPPSCWIVDSKASPRVVRTMTRDSPRGALARARRAESRLVERDSEAGVSSVAIASESTMPTTSRLSTKLSWCDTEELPQCAKFLPISAVGRSDAPNNRARSAYGEFAAHIN